MTSWLQRWLEAVWWKTKKPPLWLRQAAVAYRLINRWHLGWRQHRAFQPPLPLISVGNITVGGSGKTPFTLWLATELKARGFKPVILCRGDGGKLNATKVVAPEDSADLVGDEAKLLFDAGVAPVIRGRNRMQAAEMAGGLGDVLILDDGFQYRSLARCCDILLIPASGVGNGHLLPAGPLREPLASCARADVIVRTGEGVAVPLIPVKQWRWRCVPEGLVQATGHRQATPRKVLAACAIARPERFCASLAAVGCEVAARCFFADHHRYTRRDVERLLAYNLPVAVTAKDEVKLRPLWPPDVPLWQLRLKPQAEEGLLDAIIQHILAAKSA